ncbi:ImmA/IrrE family metallo-endopeptidase [Staphylococcus pseudoxylosus]|uniref:ImmA/IrrE family metallo-endopeptidase n=1 Tax=Staphylococcus pseudoxylosus TaxID=2282419 RepID=UPI002DB6D649|nr:ImmA/IrrE family metallo-endopeptidase [Staphylococcus pseudoxylosus]MEB6060815.1 ImmA/IrrE family metallo-endopeptidase [Staphylococcus pseudoxylosus]
MNYEENQAFMNAVESANQCLVWDSYPVPIKEIIEDDPNVILMTFAEASQAMGLSRAKLMELGKSKEAFHIKKGNKKVIIYNSLKQHRRIRFSLAHEYGHVVLNHKGKTLNDEFSSQPVYSKKEYEADTFASCLLFPLHKRLEFKNKSSYEIANAFDISFRAVGVSMSIIEKHVNSGLCEHLSVYAHRKRDSYINYLREICN